MYQIIYQSIDPEGFRFGPLGDPQPSATRFRFRPGDRAFFGKTLVAGPAVVLSERPLGRSLFLPGDREEGGFLAHPWPAEGGFVPSETPISHFSKIGEQLAEEIAEEAIDLARETGEAIEWAPILPGRYVSPTIERIGRELYSRGIPEEFIGIAEETPNPELARKFIRQAFEAQLTAAYCRRVSR